MSKVTLPLVGDITQSTTAQTTINSDLTAIQTAFENTLSRDGTSPNQMNSALDMNSNQIYNLPAPSSQSSPARLIDVVSNPTIVIPGTGTSGHVVPFLDTNNTFSGNNTFTGSNTFTGNVQGSVWGNVRASKTANYTVLNADKGLTLALGGSAYYTLTFGTASGYDANFFACVINEDTIRSKNIVLTGGPTFKLFPGQSLFVFNQNNVWQTLPRDRRWILTSSVTIYVDVTLGADTNDGLASGSGNALKTIQAAISLAAFNFDLNGVYNVTIQLADGTYPENISFPPYVGRGTQGHAGPIIIQGNVGNASAVMLQPASGHCVTAVQTGGLEWVLKNIKFVATAGNCILADLGSWVVCDGCVFGNCSGSQAIAENGGVIEFISSYTINGSGPVAHLYATSGGRILYSGGQTITIAPTPAYSSFFAGADSQGYILAPGLTFSGGITGQRYNAQSGGGIVTGSSASATYFPGTIAGTATSPGFYT